MLLLLWLLLALLLLEVVALEAVALPVLSFPFPSLSLPSPELSNCSKALLIGKLSTSVDIDVWSEEKNKYIKVVNYRIIHRKSKQILQT